MGHRLEDYRGRRPSRRDPPVASSMTVPRGDPGMACRRSHETHPRDGSLVGVCSPRRFPAVRHPFVDLMFVVYHVTNDIVDAKPQVRNLAGHSFIEKRGTEEDFEAVISVAEGAMKYVERADPFRICAGASAQQDIYSCE